MKSACLMLFVCLFTIVFIGCDNSVTPNEPDNTHSIFLSSTNSDTTITSHIFFANTGYEINVIWNRKIVTTKYNTWTDLEWYDRLDLEFPMKENLMYNYGISGLCCISPAGPFWTSEDNFSIFTLPYEVVKKSYYGIWACIEAKMSMTASDGVKSVTENYKFSVH